MHCNRAECAVVPGLRKRQWPRKFEASISHALKRLPWFPGVGAIAKILEILGEALDIKSVTVDRGEVTRVNLEPATPEETADTVAVMGGEDWEFWIEALLEADVLAQGCKTLAFTYIGTELTWPIYWDGTLGQAKLDLDRASRANAARLARDRCAIALVPWEYSDGRP